MDAIKISTAREDILRNKYKLSSILYRHFDKRYTIFSGKTKGFLSYPRANVMTHFIKGQNLGLVIGRQGQAMGNGEWNIIYIADTILDSNIFYRGRGTVFALYIYDQDNQQTIEQFLERIPNLNLKIINQIAEKLNLTFTNEKETTKATFAPIDILDYIYAVLHSPTYREKYKEFLKIDFPRVPYPKDTDTFWQLVKLGGELRQIHLLESPVVNKFITKYPKDGDNVVTKISFIVYNYIHTPLGEEYPDYLGTVSINDQQFFENVPQSAWEFYIGGYKPAQKWLKDRKGRKLEFEDILHYQKIIVAITETSRLMKEIDKIEVE